jgi:hypothetical protein
MKFLTLIILLFAFPSFAQKSEVFQIDSLPTEGVGSAFIISLPFKIIG